MSERITQLRRPPDPTLVDQLEKLIHEVVTRLDEQQDCDQLVTRINTLSGQAYDAEYFFELHGWTSARDAAAAAAKGAPPRMTDLTRAELIEIVQIISEGEEPDSSYLLATLLQSYPDCGIGDLIYHPHKDLTAAETADEILLRQRLYEKGGSDAVRMHEVELAREIIRDPQAAIWSRSWADAVLNSQGRQGSSDGNHH